MSITLYHCDGSRSMRPIWTMEEMGIDYDSVQSVWLVQSADSMRNVA